MLLKLSIYVSEKTCNIVAAGVILGECTKCLCSILDSLVDLLVVAVDHLCNRLLSSGICDTSSVDCSISNLLEFSKLLLSETSKFAGAVCLAAVLKLELYRNSCAVLESRCLDSECVLTSNINA